MKLITKVFGILIASVALVACGGGGSTPPKSTPPKKVFKLIKEEITFGSVSSLNPIIIINTYDDKGVLIRQDRDTDGNGELDGRDIYYTYAYDEKGKLQTREAFDLGGHVVIIDEYDEHGNSVSSLNDTSRDGVFDFSGVFVNTYDDAGRLLVREGPNTTTKYSYNENTVIMSIDFDPEDGEPNVISAETYNEYGDLIKYQRDSNGDGVYDSSGVIYAYTYTFDNNNNIIRKEEDRTNNNNPVDRITVYTWEELK